MIQNIKKSKMKINSIMKFLIKLMKTITKIVILAINKYTMKKKTLKMYKINRNLHKNQKKLPNVIFIKLKMKK